MSATDAIEQHLDRARALIRATRGRATQPRLRVLAALLCSDQALGHADLRQRLPDVDRVSRYRSLEWLLEHGLAFRFDDAGHPRYGASHQEHDHRTRTSIARRAGMTTCLSHVATPVVQLPTGCRTTDVEMLIKGLCRSCTSR